MQDMIESDHRKESLQANRPILCRGLARWLEQRHIVIANSNVADKKKSSICAVQSIVQVTHSHNPFIFSSENPLQLFVYVK